MTMTDREKTIAEIREAVKLYPQVEINLLETVDFLLSELDREHEENRRLREERDKLIEGLRPLMKDLGKMAVNPSNARAFPSYRRMREILKKIGITMDVYD